jgi:hypothetical protein
MAGIGRRQVRGGERPAVKKLINNGHKNTIAVKALPLVMLVTQKRKSLTV